MWSVDVRICVRVCMSVVYLDIPLMVSEKLLLTE